ncbi:Uncharacterized protein FKW44_001923 [Caligus rogercresseyi]|uniref:Uncharacterized protein n=1 Tax=Caligus rogercresseyi TaxID=217165 RepID=A0A7T8KJI1_CALRO|nr:Uncharacterized protein FKW44_001923 [Caligus rogercresseyi]
METEKRIEKVMGIKDAKKRVLSLEASPDGRFTVALDLQHRVELFDNDYGRLLHVWKGYHHARTAWIFSQETEKDPSVLLLAIYSPRRKKIEIWSPVNKARITEFPVEDPGTFLKSKDDSKFINLVTGDIFSFVVPFSSVHDPLQGIDKFKRTLHKFYRLRPQDEDAEKYLKELLYLIRSAGSQHQQCSLLLELCQSANVSTKQGLFACNSLKGESQGDIISAFIEKLLAIIDLKVHLESIEAQREAFEGSLDEFIVDNFPGNEVAEFSTDIHLSSSVPIEAISFGKFMSFVEINRFCLPEFRSLNGPNLLPFTFHIASGFLETHMQETKRLLSLACPDLDLSRIFFASATQGSLSMDNMGMFAPLLKNFWGYVSQKFETHRLSAKNFFYHSLMNESNLGIMKLWIGFVGEGAEPNEDLLRVSGLVRTYLLLRKNFLQIAQSSVLKDNTFDEVFNKGNGMLPTVIVSWFVESELRLEVAEEFRSNNEFLFPHSLCSDTFYVHFAFSLFAFQSSALVKNPLSFKDIKSILTDKIQTPVLKHRLSAVLWNNFAKGYVRTLLELFKGPSFKDSAHREVGIREDFMSEFFEFLHFIKTFDLYHWEVVEERVDNLIKYDDVSLVEQPFVGDVINGFSRTEEYEYSAGIYFQAIIIIQFMWQFRIEVNPLSLFKPRDLDEIIFLQEEKQHQSSRGMSLGFGGLLSGLGGDIKRHRNAFLEKTSFRLVDLIESGEGDALRREEFDSWATKYYTISGYWNLRSKSKRYVMRDLYKAGYDAAGREMFEPSSFEQDELHELKSIACLRLAKILSQASPSTTAIVNSVKPELIQKLAYCEVFTKDLVDVPIRKTRDLFSLICSVDEDPEMLDYLSIVRSIQDAELE